MKRIVFISITIILLLSIVRLSTSIYTLWHKQDLLTNAKLELAQEKKENQNLQKQLVVVKSPQFLEEEARNKLLLVKPGESDVLIDSSLLHGTAAAKAKEAAKPFWQQWWDLFFN